MTDQPQLSSESDFSNFVAPQLDNSDNDVLYWEEPASTPPVATTQTQPTPATTQTPASWTPPPPTAARPTVTPTSPQTMAPPPVPSPQLAGSTNQWIHPKTPRRLPTWIDLPTLLCLPVVIVVSLITAAAQPLILLGAAPLITVGGFLWWLGALKPDNRAFWVRALLFGASVPIVIAACSQPLVRMVFPGADTSSFYPYFSLVMQAPFIEEIFKALIIIAIAVKARRIETPLEGVIIAGFSALGFAAVENFLYLSYSIPGPFNWELFWGRCVVLSFTHFNFTIWIGYAVGDSVEKRLPFSSSWWGWVVAIILHGLWNGPLLFLNGGTLEGITSGSGTNPDTPLQKIVLTVYVIGWFSYFLLLMAFLISKRQHAARRFSQQLAWLVHYYRIPIMPVNIFFSRDTIKAARKSQDRATRRRFDVVSSNLVRLGELNDYYIKNGRMIHPSRRTETELVVEMDQALRITRTDVAVFTPSRPNQANDATTVYQG